MIIDNNYLLDFGLPISDEISQERLDRAIQTAENLILQPRLGNDLYIAILNSIRDEDGTYDTYLNGGVVEKTNEHGDLIYTYLTGLRAALAHIAYGILLTGYINATTFGAVLKKDDYSDQAGLDRIRTIGMVNIETGLWYIKEVTDWLGIDNKGKWLPDIHEELI